MNTNEVIDFNEERLAFYTQIGLAVTHWAHVEFALSWVVGSCFGRRNGRRAAAGFLSIENIRSKLQHSDQILAHRRMSKTERANWADLVEWTGKLATKRNSLAHSWVFNDIARRPGRRVMLLPTRPSKKNPKQKYPGALCVRDIAGYRLEFVALMKGLENFQHRLSGQEEQFPEPLERQPRLPTLANLRQEIYAFASRPPLPSRA